MHKTKHTKHTKHTKKLKKKSPLVMPSLAEYFTLYEEGEGEIHSAFFRS